MKDKFRDIFNGNSLSNEKYFSKITKIDSNCKKNRVKIIQPKSIKINPNQNYPEEIPVKCGCVKILKI